MSEFGLGIEVNVPFDEVVLRTRLSMKACGFGVLSEMPEGEGLPGSRRHLFMGVWEGTLGVSNLGGPGLDVGDQLPCNFVVWEEAGKSLVAALDPGEGLEGWEVGTAAVARAALSRVFEEIARG